MPDSEDKPFRPNERVAETLAKADQKRMQETMRRRPSLHVPSLYKTTVGRRNPTDGLHPVSREEEWRLVRQAKPEEQKKIKDHLTNSYQELFGEGTVKVEDKNRVDEMLKKANISKEIGGAADVIGKPVPNDPTPVDKARDIGQNLQNKDLIKQDLEPGKE